jgi:hypothetical protein
VKHVKLFELIGCPLTAIGLVLLIVALQAGASDASVVSHVDATDPWVVFTPASSSLPMSANLLANAGFETGSPGTVSNWNTYGSGYSMDESGGHNSGRALLLVNSVSTETHGAYQVVTLQANALALPAQSLTAIALLPETAYPLSAGTARTLKATLAPQASEVLVLSNHAIYLPLTLK